MAKKTGKSKDDSKATAKDKDTDEPKPKKVRPPIKKRDPLVRYVEIDCLDGVVKDADRDALEGDYATFNIKIARGGRRYQAFLYNVGPFCIDISKGNAKGTKERWHDLEADSMRDRLKTWAGKNEIAFIKLFDSWGGCLVLAEENGGPKLNDAEDADAEEVGGSKTGLAADSEEEPEDRPAEVERLRKQVLALQLELEKKDAILAQHGLSEEMNEDDAGADANGGDAAVGGARGGGGASSAKAKADKQQKKRGKQPPKTPKKPKKPTRKQPPRSAARTSAPKLQEKGIEEEEGEEVEVEVNGGGGGGGGSSGSDDDGVQQQQQQQQQHGRRGQKKVADADDDTDDDIGAEEDDLGGDDEMAGLSDVGGGGGKPSAKMVDVGVDTMSNDYARKEDVDAVVRLVTGVQRRLEARRSSVKAEELIPLYSQLQAFHKKMDEQQAHNDEVDGRLEDLNDKVDDLNGKVDATDANQRHFEEHARKNAALDQEKIDRMNKDIHRAIDNQGIGDELRGLADLAKGICETKNKLTK